MSGAGLIDEIVVFVAPILFGDGRRLVSRLDKTSVELVLLEAFRAKDVTTPRFRVLR